jgi:hypothetical protein
MYIMSSRCRSWLSYVVHFEERRQSDSRGYVDYIHEYKIFPMDNMINGERLIFIIYMVVCLYIVAGS